MQKNKLGHTVPMQKKINQTDQSGWVVGLNYRLFALKPCTDDIRKTSFKSYGRQVT